MMMLPECLAINAVRLARDWTWRDVGHEMARAGVPMSWRTVHYLCTHDPPPLRPLDRTLHKLRTFVRYLVTKGWVPAPPPEGDAHAAPVLRSHDPRPAARPRRPARLRE